MTESGAERLRRVVLCLLGVVPAVWAVVQLGRLHPDEVYQLLEPAYFRAHGYGVRAWEWQVGLRNWVFPGLAAGLLELADALGIRHPVAYRAVLAVPQAALHVASIFAVHRYLGKFTDSSRSFIGALLYGTYGLVLLFAGRTLGESISTSFLVLAVAGLESGDEPRQQVKSGTKFWLGPWLGLAVVARYGSAIVVLVALVVLAAQRRWRILAGTVAGGAVVALGLAIVDAVTWGRLLHSLWAYVDFNVLSGEAARRFGSAPWTFYAQPMALLVPLWVWPGLVASWRAREHALRPVLPLACGLVYLATIAFTPHKEVRFLYPGLVLLLVASLPGWLWLWGRLPTRAWRTSALVASVVLGAVSVPLYPWDLRGDQFRAIVRATRGNATGLLIVNEGLWGAGGYFYVGRNIPWTTCDWAADASFRRAMADPRFNRAVTFEGRELDALRSHGFRVSGTVGRETLLER